MEDLGPFTIPNSHTHDFTAKSNGRRYRAWVATPSKMVPGQPKPILYATDGNMGFGQIVECTRLMAFSGEIPPVIVVGIGYPDITAAEGMVLRNYELTPTVDREYIDRTVAQGAPVGAEGLAGAPGFHQFIRDELAPVIEDLYGGDPNDRALFGYSLGGLFTGWTLLQDNPGFQRFIAGSPSFWWDNRVIFQMEAARAEGPRSLRAKVFISAGENEEQPGGNLPPWAGMVSNALQFAALIGSRKYEGFDIDYQLIPRVGHYQPPMLVQGLSSVYRGHGGIVRPAGI
jgi:predicted alpha/beta superfamily hydrolase